MAVKVDEARANTAKDHSLFREAREREGVWRAKAHEAEAPNAEAEARKVEAEKQLAGLQAEMANLREMQDAHKREVSGPSSAPAALSTALMSLRHVYR